MSNKLKFILVGLLVVVVAAVVIWSVSSGPSKPPKQPPKRPGTGLSAERPAMGTNPLSSPLQPAGGDTLRPRAPFTPTAPAGPTTFESRPTPKTGSPAGTDPKTGLAPSPGPLATAPKTGAPAAGTGTSAGAPFPSNLQPEKTQPSGMTPTGTNPLATAPKTGPGATGTTGGITPPPFGGTAPKGPGLGMPPISPVTPAEPPAKEYTVKKGDSLWLIAKKEYGEATEDNINKIVDANKDKLANKNALLSVNMKLKIPAKAETRKDTAVGMDITTSSGSKTYTIQEGDSLSGISAKLFKSEKYWKKIWEANKDKIPNPDKLKTGTEITIPDVGQSGTPAAVKEEHAVAPAGGSVYTIEKGDSFALISQKLFKSEKYWKKIWEANKDKFPEPTKLKPGSEIVIPAIEGITPPSSPSTPAPSPTPFTTPPSGLTPPPFSPAPMPGKTVDITPKEPGKTGGF